MKSIAILALSLVPCPLSLVLPHGSALAQDKMFFPLPATAAGPAIDPKVGYVVEEPGRGLYLL